jgi:PAS domain S-box-containing protein
MFGYEPGEALGKEMMSLTIAPESIEFAKKQVTTDSMGPYEFIGLRKDGTRFPIEANIRKMEYKGRNVRFGAIRDITERKQAEEALKASEQKYRNLMENASDPILLADMQGNIIEANRKAEELWGYTKEELLQMHYTQLHPMQELEKTIAAFKKIIEKNSGYLSGGFIQRKEGDIIPVDITCNVIEYVGRKVVQASFRDISEHKQAKDILEKLVRERTAELSRNNELLKFEIKERKNAEAAMKRKTKELKHHTDKLTELNAALKVLLKQREDDKNDMADRFVMNIRHLILPFVEQMKKEHLNAGQRAYLDIVETHLHDIATPLLKNIRQFNFTPKEIKVAMLVKEDKSTKEIAEILGIATGSIDVHRKNIRKKLGLSNRKANLQSHLVSLE